MFNAFFSRSHCHSPLSLYFPLTICLSPPPSRSVWRWRMLFRRLSLACSPTLSLDFSSTLVHSFALAPSLSCAFTLTSVHPRPLPPPPRNRPLTRVPRSNATKPQPRQRKDVLKAIAPDLSRWCSCMRHETHMTSHATHWNPAGCTCEWVLSCVTNVRVWGKSQSIFYFSRSLLPRSVEKRLMRLRFLKIK